MRISDWSSDVCSSDLETPGSAVEVMRCIADAGVPGEVAQLVFGVPDTISRRLLASHGTRKLSFTGSVPVGKHLMRIDADPVSKMTRERGGHGPALGWGRLSLDKTPALERTAGIEGKRGNT